MAIKVTDEELKKDVEAYIKAGGNRSEAARQRGVPRTSINDRLREAEVRLGVQLGKIADGRVEQVVSGSRPLPAKGKVARYILTSVQNNTYLHPAWVNVMAYKDWLDDLTNGSCELIVGTFSYALDAYGQKAVKYGTWKPDTPDQWYAPEILDYIKDSSIRLAPGLMWCGEMNILPTALHPLSGLETYNGRQSNIIPHAKVAMESVPSLPDEATKFNYSTGAITQRNYIQKRAGIIAEQKHSYAALIVEVDSDGNWWVRQLHVDGNGHIYDIGPAGYGPIKVADGAVVDTLGARVDSITWGDIHVAEMEPWVMEAGWAPEGMLDALRPRRQFMHDIFSMRSRSPHEAKDFHKQYAKFVNGADSVEAEVIATAKFLRDSHRDWCQTIVIPSNHDRHLNRWLNESDPRHDVVNAKYHNVLQAALLDALDKGVKRFNILRWALEKKGVPKDTIFLIDDESYVICRDVDGGIECGLHGDRGPGGSRGSTRGLTRLGRAVNKGHDHTAAIRDNVYSAGACSLAFDYMVGPSAHSITHIVTFENGRRQLITMWAGRYRA